MDANAARENLRARVYVVPQAVVVSTFQLYSQVSLFRRVVGRDPIRDSRVEVGRRLMTAEDADVRRALTPIKTTIEQLLG